MDGNCRNGGNNAAKYFISAFALGACPFLIAALSFVIQNGGMFYLYSDFNAQQIPFTIYLSRNISDMRFPQFDFNAGTGLDYFDAYTFYNLFSPFTLLYALVPDSFITYAFTFVIAVKFGVCGLSAYTYISRFCQKKEYALLGAVLYAYSGYQTVNLVFHYLDALALFPFLLAALESAATQKRRGIFGAAVLFCAVTNYYIFGMEVVFLVIYFIVRLTDKNFRISVKDFFCLAAESVLGVMAAGIVIVPAIVCILNNPRAGEPFGGLKDMLIYETPWRYARIFQSMFMLPDLQSYTNIFPDFQGDYPYGSKWSSLGMYLPMFGMSGVIAYIQANKKSPFTKIAALCVIMAFVPVLNSLFSLGSSVYYARWMFAPTLIMSAMTACALENEPKYFKTGLIVQTTALLAIILFSIIFPIEKLTQWESGAYYNNVQKWVNIAVTASGIILAAAIIFAVKRDGQYPQKVLLAAVTAVFAVSEVTLLFDMGECQSSEIFENGTYAAMPDIGTEQGARAVTDEKLRNMMLLWNVPTSSFFNSAVDPYVNEYCQAVGIYNDEIPEDYPSQCLLSAKEEVVFDRYENDPDRIPSQKLTDNFIFKSKKDGHAVFENTNYIPMGFCYEYCIQEDKLLSLDEDVRKRIMLKAMAVDNAEEVSGYLEPIPDEEIYALDDEEFAEECAKRAAKAASGYYTDDDSYNAVIELDEPELVFFSVAYNKGFTAYVDGEEVPICNANFGFQAIPVPAGKHTIKCVYHSQWRDIGTVLSIIGVSLLIVYSAAIYILRRKRKN